MDSFIYALAGELIFGGALTLFLYKLTIPVWKKPIRVPETVADRITYDSDIAGMV